MGNSIFKTLWSLTPFSKDRRRIAERQKYIDVCLEGEGRRMGRITTLKQKIFSFEQQIVQFFTKLIHVGSVKKEMEFELDGLTQLMSAKSAKARDEFDELLDIPEVHLVEFESGIIRVITTPIVLETHGHRYNLGRFAIEIIENARIDIRPLEPCGFDTTFDHPHISKGKSKIPLHLRVPLAKLLGGLEYADVTQIMINLLKTYDEETCLVKIDQNWKGARIETSTDASLDAEDIRPGGRDSTHQAKGSSSDTHFATGPNADPGIRQ